MPNTYLGIDVITTESVQRTENHVIMVVFTTIDSSNDDGRADNNSFPLKLLHAHETAENEECQLTVSLASARFCTNCEIWKRIYEYTDLTNCVVWAKISIEKKTFETLVFNAISQTAINLL